MADASALMIAAAGRPVAGEVVSGDAWQTDWYADMCRVAVIDGLGHGADAAHAADAAKAVLAANPDLPPVAALQACHGPLRGTRGAAMWIGALDLAGGRVEYAGVGNVDARLWHAPRQERLVGQRGIVGGSMPTLRAFQSTLEPGWILVIHTDGIRDKFDLADFAPPIRDDAEALANALLAEWARATDDALVVAICPRA